MSGLEEAGALWLTVGVSVLLGVAALFISQELSADAFTPENLLAVFGQVLAAATLAYQFLVKPKV